jgi:hypothetical protein
LLRQRREKLLQSPNRHSPLPSRVLTERPPLPSRQLSPKEHFRSDQGKTIVDFKLKLTAVEVSEFKEHDVENIKISIIRKAHKLIPPLMAKHHGKEQPNTTTTLHNLHYANPKIARQRLGLAARSNECNLLVNPEIRALIFKSKRAL